MSDWPHAPARRKIDAGTYFLTAGTLGKVHYFHDKERLDLLESTLLKTCAEFGWNLQAWAVFSNHYHFVASTGVEEPDLARTIKTIHGRTSRWVNVLDGVEGRQVWYRYRDTKLTNQRSYFARLSYVHWNPVKHKLVRAPEMYEWCSADWFAKTADPPLYNTVVSFPTDKLDLDDDF